MKARLKIKRRNRSNESRKKNIWWHVTINCKTPPLRHVSYKFYIQGKTYKEIKDKIIPRDVSKRGFHEILGYQYSSSIVEGKFYPEYYSYRLSEIIDYKIVPTDMHEWRHHNAVQEEVLDALRESQYY